MNEEYLPSQDGDSLDSLLEEVVEVFDEYVSIDRKMQLSKLKERAREIGKLDAIVDFIDECKSEERSELRKERKANKLAKQELPLELDDNGKPKTTIANFFTILQNDPQFKGVKYNLMLDAPEVFRDGQAAKRWTDADKSSAKCYIQSKYRIHSAEMFRDALNMFFREREYNPVIDLIESFKWDGVNRCEHFLHKWLKCEDSEYSRECSRIIFANGIWRLYQPGCKADECVVLVGEKQGEGKSTVISWLALHDDYYGEIKTVETDKAIEQLKGKWICEIAELSAFTKAKDVAAVKAFITRQRDEYRKPYQENPEDLLRRCIMIGSTNESSFLIDRSGNRRFFPIECHSVGYELWDKEQECREYICQCWAEALVRYKEGKMPNFAKRELKDEYEKRQSDAMADDWRVGAIGAYLETKEVGELVCAKEIMNKALSPSIENPKDPTMRDSKEIGQIMNKHYPEWAKVGQKRTKNFGNQKCWQKMQNADNPFDNAHEDDLPL